MPNINIDIEDILNIFDKNVDMFNTFELNPDEINIKTNISNIYNNKDFNNFLNKKKLKKGKLENTKDNQTLLNDDYILTFFFIYEEKTMELDEPLFVFLQYYNTINNKLSDIKVFENNNNINDFYRKLTDTNIELIYKDKTYIYTTSNSGNNWELKNTEMISGDFKSNLDIDEMNNLLKNNKIKINK
ncbi:MAG: hypothetical protein WDA02_08540 [Saccharofermentanales bacterium]